MGRRDYTCMEALAPGSQHENFPHSRNRWSIRVARPVHAGMVCASSTLNSDVNSAKSEEHTNSMNPHT